MKKIIYCLITLILSLLISCDDDSKGSSGSSFDRKAMLENYAEQIIISYEELVMNTEKLNQALNTFAETPNTTNLLSAQSAWKTAYSSWQTCNSFNFGPAESAFGTLLDEVGTFPVSSSKIETYITNGDNTFQNFDRDARGFLTVEYLLFNLNDNQEVIINQFQNSPNRKAYLRALGARLSSEIKKVNTSWVTFKTEFVNNSGTDASSSTSELYNNMVKSFEAIKNFKIGLPAGKRPGQTKTEPQLVEAYYSGSSVEVLKLHFQAIENIWKGDIHHAGVGFKEYLSSVEGGNDLIVEIENQISNAKIAINALPEGRLSNTIETNLNSVSKVHEELQKLTRYLKSDMSSLLGISITYDSGDGD
ncbi:MAG: hypothetical protein OHK0038_05990 [Flammeovirgaceae bacterium]